MAMLEREYVVPPMGELRLSAAAGGVGATMVTLQPRAVEGGEQPRADVFGTELAPGVAVRLPAGRSFGVFSPTGCALTVAAPSFLHQTFHCTLCSVTWARSVADVNTHLEVLRVKARRVGADGLGPRVLFVAERRAAGTSTYVRILMNYALRLGYHPLLLDAAVEAPRFGYPGVLSLYAMQQTVDIEEELCFVPAMHAYQGTGKHEDPALFLHALRELMRLGTERMARSDRCRVGGLFVDYGTISRSLVEEAEAWECAEEGRGDRSKTNPLDVLVDTLAEADIDHVFVVGSAWLRFKVAQRVHQRFGTPQDLPLAAPTSVVCGSGLRVHLFLLDATGCAVPPDDAFFRRECWQQYFFGTRTAALRPAVLTVDTSLIRLVLLGRGDPGSMSTFMPMADEDDNDNDNDDPQSGLAPRGASLTYVHPQDVDLTDRVLAVSAAAGQEELPDGTMQRIPFAAFESRLRRALVVGFALVESMSSSAITLVTSAAGLREDSGPCFILTEERLARHARGTGMQAT